MKFEFEMSDAWGDDYNIVIESETEEKAWSIATMIDDDAVPRKLLGVQEYASEYNKLINGEAVVLPKDREHAEALIRVGMFYLENNK
jgi:hypothetical protein